MKKNKTNLYDTINQLIEWRDKNIEDINNNPYLRKKLDFFEKLSGVIESPMDLMIERSKIIFKKTLLEIIVNYEKQIKLKL